MGLGLGLGLGSWSGSGLGLGLGCADLLDSLGRLGELGVLPLQSGVILLQRGVPGLQPIELRLQLARVLHLG